LNALTQNRIAHGYIFSGHRGIGKTTIARILAMALNCRSSDKPVEEPCGVCESCTEIRAGNSVDVIEIDAATNRGIDEIREIREGTRYRPARDRFKICILDEAHQITDAAFNALLKTLEEPPDHMVFMLATTQPEDIPQTIRSRCQHFSFRAVRFEEIMNQLRDLSARENISADDDALAMLAEAGDGSMRDALSILDQAIASCDGRLTAESIRQLVGAAPSGAMEEVMKAVSDGSSDQILRQVDRLISEGQNSTHFARQMVRFIRNTVVAKVAGSDSSLLQISSDERQRVARIAELFSEEDLARHLQIILRTHAELGYRQEQRFHLELGLLKMAHAQRLLPIEQFLSEASASAGGAPRPPGKPSVVPDARKAEAAPPSRSSFVSPFAADSARKGSGKPQLSSEPAPSGARMTSAVALAPVILGAAVAEEMREPIHEVFKVARPPEAAATAIATAKVEVVAVADGNEPAITQLRAAVLEALSDAGHRMLVSMLESGDWKLDGNELLIKVASSAAVIDMSLGADARKLAIASAVGLIGRQIKLKVITGDVGQVAPTKTVSTNGSGRSRAEQDPIVRRMKETFGAEIRTIIDYREKK
jgi:DNA polymerase-3 subunit gamma/tau